MIFIFAHFFYQSCHRQNHPASSDLKYFIMIFCSNVGSQTMMHSKVLCLLIVLDLVWISVADETDSFCGSPGDPRFGFAYIYADRYEEGSTMEYNCEASFFTGDLTRRCVNGTWSGQMPVCLEGFGMDITSGNITRNGDNALDHQNYDCILTDRGGRLFCKLNKTDYIGEIWLFASSPSDEVHQGRFQLRITSDGRNVHNGVYHLDLGKPYVSTKFKEPVHGDTMEIEAIGRTSTTAIEFTDLVILVIPECGEPEIPLNSEVEYNNNGTSITYKCIPGYRVVGNVVRQCQKSGVWTGEQPRCLRDTSPSNDYFMSNRAEIRLPSERGKTISISIFLLYLYVSSF